LAPVQIGEFGFEQVMAVCVAPNVASAAAAGAKRKNGLDHRIEHHRVLPHAEIVVGAPDRHLVADAVLESAREEAAAPLDIGKDAIAALDAELIETLCEIGLVIHGIYLGGIAVSCVPTSSA